MKVDNAIMQMAVDHAATQSREIRQALRAWVGDRSPDFPDEPARPLTAPAPSVRVDLSEAGKAAQASASDAIEQEADETSKDPRLMLLRAIVSLLTGKEVRVFDARELQLDPQPLDLPGPAAAPGAAAAPTRGRAGFGVEYDYHESYSETELTTFSASGVVHTADGREIAFKLDLAMSRSYYEESNVSLRLGNAVRPQKDPLVVNFGGSAAQLSDQRFSFDLDADGSADRINRLAGGSGFLALDRNGDGRINDGGELFGALSGDGFADLAAYDGDGNGWIDEADAVYSQLRVWTPDAAGSGELQTLQAADVDAIALAHVATPFALRDAGNDSLGQIRSSGLFLHESGGAGTIQQIDLSV